MVRWYPLQPSFFNYNMFTSFIFKNVWSVSGSVKNTMCILFYFTPFVMFYRSSLVHYFFLSFFALLTLITTLVLGCLSLLSIIWQSSNYESSGPICIDITHSSYHIMSENHTLIFEIVNISCDCLNDLLTLSMRYPRYINVLITEI